MVTLGYYVGIPFSNPFLRFYAICIVIGACVALVLSNYRAHKDGFDIHFFDFLEIKRREVKAKTIAIGGYVINIAMYIFK